MQRTRETQSHQILSHEALGFLGVTKSRYSRWGQAKRKVPSALLLSQKSFKFICFKWCGFWVRFKIKKASSTKDMLNSHTVHSGHKSKANQSTGNAYPSLVLRLEVCLLWPHRQDAGEENNVLSNTMEKNCGCWMYFPNWRYKNFIHFFIYLTIFIKHLLYEFHIVWVRGYVFYFKIYSFQYSAREKVHNIIDNTTRTINFRP